MTSTPTTRSQELPETGNKPMPPGAALRAGPGARLIADRHLWGFGGAHGGLTLAHLVAAMTDGDTAGLRNATAQFVRPIRSQQSIRTRVTRRGRRTQMYGAEAYDGDDVTVVADAIVTNGRRAARLDTLSWAPRRPDVGSPDSYDVFALPTGIVPIAQYVEIHPVGSSRPFGGGDLAELVAWVRLTEDDEPPDVLRLIMMLDALAPSVTATMTELVVVPTVEFTVRPAPNATTISSPWLLLRAHTLARSSDGWIDERIDAWSIDGAHVGSAHQLRLVRPVPSAGRPEDPHEPTISTTNID